MTGADSGGELRAAALVETRRLLEQQAAGMLATAMVERSSHPYVSLATFAVDKTGAPLFLFSDLADHTKNIKADWRVSLMVEDASHLKNPQTGPRVTLVGTLTPTKDLDSRSAYLKKHPSAGKYAGFADFQLYRMTVEALHFVGGFGAATWLEKDDLKDLFK